MWKYHTDLEEGPIHAWPLGDIVEHDLRSDPYDECSCGPDVEFYAVPFVIHHSLDGREQNENQRASSC